MADTHTTYEGMLMDKNQVPYNSSINDFNDVEGNIRVQRVVWKSFRKIGIRTFMDEQGMIEKTFVDENYEPKTDIGEKIKWVWVTEWWEGTKIGNDIYVKMQPRPIQFRRGETGTAGGSGYIGTIYNVDRGKAVALLDFIKPYQYMSLR